MKKRSKKKRRGGKGKGARSLLERPAEVAAYFGFTSISSPKIGKEDVKAVRAYVKGSGFESERNEDIYKVEEKARLLRYYDELRGYPQDYFFFYRKPLSGGSFKPRSSHYECGLEVLGSARGIAEAILIQTSLSILSEEGFTDLEIALNSIGDKESTSLLERELVNYYRKNIERLPAVCRQMFKKDIFEILRCQSEECRAAVEDAPEPLSLLSETARAQFKEVLEFVEHSRIPYTIDKHLIENPLYASHTVFEIKGTSKTGRRLTCAAGYRYNQLTKKIGMKKEVPAIGVTISFKREGRGAFKRMPKPKFYLIQLGPAAKLKGLFVIETLRKARIPILHALTKDKYAAQAGTAENMRTPFVLIIGQKEAMENTVVVRDAKTRFQDTVPIAQLASYLKKLSS